MGNKPTLKPLMNHSHHAGTEFFSVAGAVIHAYHGNGGASRTETLPKERGGYAHGVAAGGRPTAAAADEEVRKLLNDSYDQAKKILTENRGLLDEVALYLLQKETITGDELMQYVDADKRLRGSKQETLPEAEA